MTVTSAAGRAAFVEVLGKLADVTHDPARSHPAGARTLTGRLSRCDNAPVTVPAQDSYALGIADASYRWYVIASKRSRRAHRIADVGAVLISASIPVVVVIAPGLPAITAVLGAVLVVIAGVRAIYHWSENYLRFSRAREEVEEQRRLFHVWAAPYDDPATRDEELVKAITRIEQAEMGQWTQVAVGRTVPRQNQAE
jgi:hypothetical protein